MRNAEPAGHGSGHERALDGVGAARLRCSPPVHTPHPGRASLPWLRLPLLADGGGGGDGGGAGGGGLQSLSKEKLQELMTDESKLQQFLAENPTMMEEIMKLL